MRVYIGYSTSLQYWLSHGTDVSCYARQVHMTSLNNAAYTLTQLQSYELEELGLEATSARGWPDRARKGRAAKRPVPTGPAIHVLVPGKLDSNRLEGFERHCWTSRIPEHSFCRLDGDVYLSLPEFSFLQLAGVLNMQQLVLVGYWLCSSYRLNGTDLPLTVDPITTVAKLEEYLAGATGCYGASKACQALRWIVDGARSPLEADVAALASLPVRLGGYGLPRPAINYQIKASDFDAETLDRDDRTYFEIDLYWKGKRVGLEYDGAIHYEHERIRKDKRRLNCLLANGERILVVMYDQLNDADVRKALMNQLAKLLGVKRRKATSKEKDERDKLLGILFGNEFSL